MYILPSVCTSLTNPVAATSESGDTADAVDVVEGKCTVWMQASMFDYLLTRPWD